MFYLNTKKIIQILNDTVPVILFVLVILIYALMVRFIVLRSELGEMYEKTHATVSKTEIYANTEPDLDKTMSLINTKRQKRIFLNQSTDEETSEESAEEQVEVYSSDPSPAQAQTSTSTSTSISTSSPSTSSESIDVSLDEGLRSYINTLCENRGVDPDIIISMIYKESRFDAGAVGDSGNSLGLMQIQPRWNSDRMNELGCNDLFDPYQNVTVGIDILADYIDQSGSIEWSLMAYNGGPSYANDKWNSGQISEYASSVISYAESINND